MIQKLIEYTPRPYRLYHTYTNRSPEPAETLPPSGLQATRSRFFAKICWLLLRRKRTYVPYQIRVVHDGRQQVWPIWARLHVGHRVWVAAHPKQDFVLSQVPDLDVIVDSARQYLLRRVVEAQRHHLVGVRQSMDGDFPARIQKPSSLQRRASADRDGRCRRNSRTSDQRIRSYTSTSQSVSVLSVAHVIMLLPSYANPECYRRGPSWRLDKYRVGSDTHRQGE